jgi:hypothetical protein
VNAAVVNEIKAFDVMAAALEEGYDCITKKHVSNVAEMEWFVRVRAWALDTNSFRSSCENAYVACKRRENVFKEHGWLDAEINIRPHCRCYDWTVKLLREVIRNEGWRFFECFCELKTGKREITEFRIWGYFKESDHFLNRKASVHGKCLSDKRAQGHGL